MVKQTLHIMKCWKTLIKKSKRLKQFGKRNVIENRINKKLLSFIALCAASLLSAGELSLIGEVRERFETLDGMNKKAYGDNPRFGQSDDKLLVSRLNFGFQYKQNPDIKYRVVGYYADVFGWSLEHDNFKKVSGSDEYWKNPQEDLDFSELSVEIKNLAGLSGLSTKIGRQNNKYGDKRVLGPGSWGNSYGHLWDLAKLSYKWDKNFIDGFYGFEKDKDKNHLSIVNKHIYEGAGIYSHFATNKKGAIEPYVIYRHGLYDGTGNGQNTEQTYTYGARAYEKDLYSFNYDFTYAKGDGNIKHKEYDAYAYVAKVGYQLKNLPWKPNIVIGQVFASGDDGTDNVNNTFRTTFGGTDGSLYGRMDIMKWSNLVENLLEVNLKPAKNMKLKLSYHDFSKDEAKDYWTYYKVANSTNSTDLGQEYDAEFKWQYSKALQFQAIYAYFNAGDAIKEAAIATPTKVQSNNAHRLFLQLDYKFSYKM